MIEKKVAKYPLNAKSGAIDCPSWSGGVDATSRKISRSSFDGADGVVVQLQQIFLILSNHPVSGQEGRLLKLRLHRRALKSPALQGCRKMAADAMLNALSGGRPKVVRGAAVCPG